MVTCAPLLSRRTTRGEVMPCANSYSLLIEEGADLLDVGGESTRPGAEPVPAALELRRILPVITGLAEPWASSIVVGVAVDSARTASSSSTTQPRWPERGPAALTYTA